MNDDVNLGYKKININDLSKSELKKLRQSYGPQHGFNSDVQVQSFESLMYDSEFSSKIMSKGFYAHPLEELRTLTESEAWFFENKSFISPYFCVQVLYKIKGYVTRSTVRRALFELQMENPCLRSGYCSFEKRVIKAVFKDRHIPVIYQNINALSEDSIQKSLDKLIEKDRAKGFDLVHGPLIRITIFHTQDGGDETMEELYSGEYAILVTESHLVMDFWDPLAFIQKTFGADNIKTVSSEGTRLLFENALKEQDANNALSSKTYLQESLAIGYWKNFLKNPPSVMALPGHKNHGVLTNGQAIINCVISDEDRELLNTLTVRNKLNDAALLQLAWGLYIQNQNNTDDALFCVLMPEPSMKTSNAAKNAALLHPVFSRVDCKEKNNVKISDLVNQQFRQILNAQSFSWLYLNDVTAEISLPSEIYSYYLSFHAFLTGNLVYEEVPALTSGRSVSMESWDAGGKDLEICFLRDGDSIKTNFRYNISAFKMGTVKQIVNDYHTVIHYLLLNWDNYLDDFWVDFGKAQISKKTGTHSQIQFQKAFEYLSNIDMFRALKEEVLLHFASAAEIHTCQKDADLPPQKDSFIFLMYGAVDRYLNFPNGVKDKLGRVWEKGWINESAALGEDVTANITITVAVSPVMIMAIPYRIIRSEETVFNYLHDHAFKAMENYLNYDKK